MKYQQVEGGLLVAQVCIFDGKTYEHLVKGATETQLLAWANGTHVQTAMPTVSAEEREFLISGITPAKWEELFGGDEE